MQPDYHTEQESIKQFKVFPSLGKKLYFMPEGNNDARIYKAMWRSGWLMAEIMAR